MHKFLSILTLSLLCFTAAAEAIYQWTDTHGVVQYGQRPPASGSYQQINIQAAPAPGGQLRALEVETKTPEPAAASTQTPPAVSAAEQRRAQLAQKERRATACAQTRSNLETLLNNPRLRRTNAAGEVERIGEDERQQLIQQARDQLKQNCD